MGQMHGIGEMVCEDERVYKGAFDRGERHGQVSKAGVLYDFIY